MLREHYHVHACKGHVHGYLTTQQVSPANVGSLNANMARYAQSRHVHTLLLLECLMYARKLEYLSLACLDLSYNGA